MIVEKKQMLLNLVNAVAMMARLDLEDGVIKKAIKTMRYGEDDKEYFWINSIDRPYPKMIMHPVASQLEGKVLDSQKFNCAMGTDQNLFQILLQILAMPAR